MENSCWSKYIRLYKAEMDHWHISPDVTFRKKVKVWWVPVEQSHTGMTNCGAARQDIHLTCSRCFCVSAAMKNRNPLGRRHFCKPTLKNKLETNFLCFQFVDWRASCIVCKSIPDFRDLQSGEAEPHLPFYGPDEKNNNKHNQHTTAMKRLMVGNTALCHTEGGAFEPNWCFSHWDFLLKWRDLKLRQNKKGFYKKVEVLIVVYR